MMKNLNSASDPKETSEKKKSRYYFSMALATGIIVSLFYLTNRKEGFESALLICTITVVFPLSFRIPLIILRGLKNGMDKEKVELILSSLMVALGLIIIGSYSEDWRFVFVLPFTSVLWTIVILMARFIKGNLDSDQRG